MNETNQKPLVGFARMSPEERRKVAARGGRTAHQRGTAHHWNSQTAIEANHKRTAIRNAKKGGESC